MRTLYGAYFKYNGQRDRPNPFAGFNFEERGPKRKRPPFPTEHITGVIMKPGSLAGLNEQARGILLASIETGSRPSEIANLMPGDIRLGDAVPHIIIQPRHDPNDPREVKTDTSERTIPLVGIALEVFKKFPNGFRRYRDNEEAASAAINKYLRENELMPSGKHTLYGFRHSLEDRMKLAGLGDDVRRMLLGHKVNREAYGTDPLEWKQKELLKIALPFDPAIVTLDRD
jgi:integrase